MTTLQATLQASADSGQVVGNPGGSARSALRRKAVLCGSYRRDHAGLRQAHVRLSSAFDVLSPRSLEFVDPGAEFVKTPSEAGRSPADIEKGHLEAMRTADFVWLHVADGYVGRSASLEVGFAHALGIPVFAAEAPNDESVASFVTVVNGVEELDEARLRQEDHPGSGLGRLQTYYRTAAVRRGWDDETARDTLLLLTEELGELARAIRKSEGLARHQASADSDVAGELADVQLYLVHLANALQLDLSGAVTAKERINAQRFSEVA